MSPVGGALVYRHGSEASGVVGTLEFGVFPHDTFPVVVGASVAGASATDLGWLKLGPEAHHRLR